MVFVVNKFLSPEECELIIDEHYDKEQDYTQW